MSDTTTTTAPDRGAPKGEAPPGSTQAFVESTVARLQAGYLATPPTSASREALAKLRRGLGHDFGTIPEALPLTVNPALRGPALPDEPTVDERATHAALTLYAVHQQSQRTRMHVPGVRFGTALGRIRYRDGAENPGVVRRFQALGTAHDLNEAVVHARALITLLRGAGVGFDYGLLAADLVALQVPSRAGAVRLRWGRDFYRARQPAADASATPTDPTPEEL